MTAPHSDGPRSGAPSSKGSTPQGLGRRDDRLQQYFDGELTAEEIEAFRAELDGELRAKLEGLEHLRTLLRAGAEEAATDLDSEALFASIEAKLAEDHEDDEDPMFPEALREEEGPGSQAPASTAERPKLEVVSGGKTKETGSSSPSGGGVSRRALWFGVTTTLAAAAAILFWVTRPSDTVPGGGQRDTPGDPGPAVAEADPPPGSEIEEVDFGYSTGAVFSVEGDGGEQYAVVWISDQKVALDEEAEERIQ